MMPLNTKLSPLINSLLIGHLLCCYLIIYYLIIYYLNCSTHTIPTYVRPSIYTG